MNPRETLRRFLQQRRDAGETELVLDSLSVDEVLQLLGAGGARGARSTDRPRAGEGPTPARPSTPPPEPGAAGETPATGDWRAALRAAGVQPSSEARRPEPPASRPAPAPPPARVSETPPGPTPPDDPPRGTRYAFDSSLGDPPGGAAEQGARAQRREPPVPLDRLPAGMVVGGATHELFGAASPYASLDDIVSAVATCTRCPLYKTARNPVPGEGNPQAGLVCVGEAPGATEDELGRPFVGQAGQLLNKILGAIDLRREDVYICNVLKHRPPGNRNPQPQEVEACSPYLVRQIELIRPKVIVAFGTFAAQTLLATKEAIGKLRGRIHRYYGVPLIVTYHPAALLRNPAWKRPTWEDVQLARRLLDRSVHE